jgi:hypothetical protein
MKKKCNRVIRPLINTMAYSTYQASKLTTAEWNNQIIPVQSAIDRLISGDWDKYECWQPMFECLNRIESMVKLNHIKDAMDWIHSAQDAMAAALDRNRLTGARAFKADEMATLRSIVSTYGDLLREVTHRQFQEACAHTNANVDRILAKGKQRSKLDRVVAGY